MLKALLIGNQASGSGHRLRSVDVPGRWILDPAAVTADDVREADLVALFGGDGTMQITLSQTLRQLPTSELPPIALLPFGTTNMNAKDLNRAKGRTRSIVSLKQAVETGQFKTLNRSMVQVAQGGHSEYGFFFGLGVIANVIEQWNAERKPGAMANQLRALWAMISGLRSTSSACEIVLDGARHSVYGLLATTLDRLLFGSRPFWGDTESGNLHVTWVDSAAQHLLRHAPALLRGQASLAAEPGFESSAIDSARLELDGPFIIDGEIFRSDGTLMTISRSEPIRWVRL